MGQAGVGNGRCLGAASVRNVTLPEAALRTGQCDGEKVTLLAALSQHSG